EVIAKLAIGAEIKFAHRLLIPVEAVVLEDVAEPECRGEIPAGGAVEHQRRRIARPAAKVYAELRVLARVAPGMELEGKEALVDALLDVPLILFHRVPGDRGGIRRNAAVLAADHFPDGHPGDAGLDVPREEIDETEVAQLQLLDPIDLPDQRP